MHSPSKLFHCGDYQEKMTTGKFLLETCISSKLLKTLSHSLQNFFDQHMGLRWTSSPMPKSRTAECVTAVPLLATIIRLHSQLRPDLGRRSPRVFLRSSISASKKGPKSGGDDRWDGSVGQNSTFTTVCIQCSLQSSAPGWPHFSRADSFKVHYHHLITDVSVFRPDLRPTRDVPTSWEVLSSQWHMDDLPSHVFIVKRSPKRGLAAMICSVNAEIHPLYYDVSKLWPWPHTHTPRHLQKHMHFAPFLYLK